MIRRYCINFHAEFFLPLFLPLRAPSAVAAALPFPTQMPHLYEYYPI